jgi:hypothetical protein
MVILKCAVGGFVKDVAPKELCKVLLFFAKIEWGDEISESKEVI